jgi:hypothetical protein
MIPLTPYQLNRIALNELMNFITTDKFIELPAPERQPYLQKLKELIKAAMAGEEELPAKTI